MNETCFCLQCQAKLCCCTETLLQEIANPQMKRRDVAMTYALALKSSETTDWKAVNTAIMNRWSKSALLWIKQQAWSGKCFQTKDFNER